jgi:hypothetical protein
MDPLNRLQRKGCLDEAHLLCCAKCVYSAPSLRCWRVIASFGIIFYQVPLHFRSSIVYRRWAFPVYLTSKILTQRFGLV